MEFTKEELKLLADLVQDQRMFCSGPNPSDEVIEWITFLTTLHTKLTK